MITIIGSGVLGLSVAAELAEAFPVLLVEKNSGFGQETSSRNSEVIHSGIYYPANSNKTRLCIEGRRLLYQYAEKHRIPFRKCGKSVVGSGSSDSVYLQKLKSHCAEVGVACEDKSDKIPRLYFPETGIIDSHALMASLEARALGNKADVLYRHRLTGIFKETQHWRIKIQSPGEAIEIESPIVINCAGLGAAEISNLALKTNRFAHRYCRGRYFALSGKYAGTFNELIYPVPQKDGLGVHVTLDLSGNARLGPDVDWSDINAYSDVENLYDCNWEELLPSFFSAAKKVVPSLQANEMTPGLIGIRPKLFVDGVAHPDFLIENNNGFIHCLGVESPGLTAALAIAKQVRKMVEER